MLNCIIKSQLEHTIKPWKPLRKVGFNINSCEKAGKKTKQNNDKNYVNPQWIHP
jgi:hypothetical protein